MAGSDDFTAVVSVMEAYFEGLHHANSKLLTGVFHRDARYVNTVEGDYMNYSAPEYFAVVDRRTPPASRGEACADRIISIEFGGTRMVQVKASMSMLGREYLDYLTLIFDDGKWQIISKVFTYVSIS